MRCWASLWESCALKLGPPCLLPPHSFSCQCVLRPAAVLAGNYTVREAHRGQRAVCKRVARFTETSRNGRARERRAAFPAPLTPCPLLLTPLERQVGRRAPRAAPQGRRAPARLLPPRAAGGARAAAAAAHVRRVARRLRRRRDARRANGAARARRVALRPLSRVHRAGPLALPGAVDRALPVFRAAGAQVRCLPRGLRGCGVCSGGCFGGCLVFWPPVCASSQQQQPPQQQQRQQQEEVAPLNTLPPTN
jgi:hypothetical protein